MTESAERMASFASTIELGQVPRESVDAAKLHLLDTLGCGLAASALGVGRFAREAVVEVVGTHPSQATLIGSEQALPAAGAALANAVICHALDFDDTHLRSMCHVSTVVCPAAVAAAQSAQRSGAELLLALLIGNEITARIGGAAAPAYMRQGFHPTSVCGIFGATLAVARIWGLSEAGMVNALGIAGGMASGTYEYLSDGSNTEATQAGWAAHGAIVASRLAMHGGSGPSSVFEGRFGLFPTYYRFDASALEEELTGLGERWETDLIAFKPYPAAHLTHACLDAARGLRERASLAPEEIEEVIVSIPEPGIALVLEPQETKIKPRSEIEARFSLQYSIAAMLVHGDVDLTTYGSRAYQDPRVLSLARRVHHESAVFSTYPSSLPGRVRIRTLDGRTLTAEMAHQRGGADNPMSANDIAQKFRRNAGLALGHASVESLLQAILGLEETKDLGILHKILGRAVGGQ